MYSFPCEARTNHHHRRKGRYNELGWPVVKASTSPLASCNHLRFLIISDTSCLRRLIGLFPLLRFLRTLLLHLLHAHVMVVVLDGLLAVAGELRLPLAIASLLFRQRLLLV
jgi:hypothetical protein